MNTEKTVYQIELPAENEVKYTADRQEAKRIAKEYTDRQNALMESGKIKRFACASISIAESK